MASQTQVEDSAGGLRGRAQVWAGGQHADPRAQADRRGHGPAQFRRRRGAAEGRERLEAEGQGAEVSGGAIYPNFREIPNRILSLAMAALCQANMHSAFMDPSSQYSPQIGILNAAHAAELFIKAIISTQHPLLIFKDIFILDDKSDIYPDVSTLIERGRTHDFEKLPQILWITTGIRIPNLTSFEKVRKIRNAVQHFCAPDSENLWNVALEFIYTNIDPLIKRFFSAYAIHFHHDVFYDHLVASIVRSQCRFSIPDDFDLTEIRLTDVLRGADLAYRTWIESEMVRISRTDLLN